MMHGRPWAPARRPWVRAPVPARLPGRGGVVYSGRREATAMELGHTTPVTLAGSVAAMGAVLSDPASLRWSAVGAQGER